MPTHCCVPLCTKKDKRDKDTREKISFFRFPDDPSTRKQWIHAIRRDVGKDVSILEGTRVCSRHFKPEDLKKSLNGRISPKPEAVPSIFAWKRSSPRKRPPPTPRFTATTVTNNLASEFSEDTHSATEFSEVTCNDSSSTNMADGTSFPETEEIPQTPEREEHNNIMTTELQEKLSAALLKIEELEAVVLQLKDKILSLEQKNEQLEEQMFSLRNDSLVTFYTGL